MAKKLLTILLSLTICLSCAACGKDATTPAAAEENTESVVVDVESSNEESTEEKTAETEETSEESEEVSSEESEEETDEKSEEVAEEASEETKVEEAKNDFVPEGDGAWLEGTGYKVFLSPEWMTVDEYKDQLKAEMAAKGKSVIAVPIMIGIENARYYNDGDLTDGAPAIVIAKPTTSSSFKSFTLKDLESQIKSSVEAAFKADENAKIEEKGIVKLAGVDALEYDVEATIENVAQKAVVYYVLDGEYFFNMRISAPVDQSADFEKEMNTIINSLTFTK